MEHMYRNLRNSIKSVNKLKFCTIWLLGDSGRAQNTHTGCENLFSKHGWPRLAKYHMLRRLIGHARLKSISVQGGVAKAFPKTAHCLLLPYNKV